MLMKAIIYFHLKILQINIDIDKEIIPNYKQANEINLYDIDLGYRKMTIKKLCPKKNIYIL